ncbi:MAG TPA: nucleoside-diphosphate sugar epimerase/dehydratase [Clostridia bacterium]|nr:nucleoside-diphosphate sugar epimerase/dehydratase [Clostridia bacterium]
MKKDKKNISLWIKKIMLVALDIVAINAATVLSLFVRFELSFSKIDVQYIENARQFLWIDTIFTLIIFTIFGLYSGLWKYASIKELFNIIVACTISYTFKYFVTNWMGISQPRSTIFFGWVLLIILVFATRFSYRFLRYIVHENTQRKGIKRIMVIGAGDAGNMIIREIRSSGILKSKVVCAIDDDKNIHGLNIQGVKIIGGRDQIKEAVKKYKVDEIIIAMPSVSSRERKKIYDICKDTQCTLRTIPGMYQIINNEVKLSDLREVQIEDLLGRDTVDINVDEILDYVKGRVILVTGAGGSIGSELCRQIAGHNPKKLVMLDIYENSIYDIQLEIAGKYPGLDMEVLIATIRDEKRIKSIMKKYKPEIVFHAAAHKHVPLMETSPNEAVKNNVFGTLTLVKAADESSVDKFIMISTDKAVKPTNIMGATKRICEMIIQAYNKKSETEFVAVRFGNVLGSNGSVIPIFRKQIEEGGPVTVTHKDITRYFMTIPEAVSLVLQAGYYAKGGEIFILDMGEPVKIYDLATNMIKLSGRTPDVDIKIEITGLRPGEKLYEELLMDEEGIEKTQNNLIYIGRPIQFDEKIFFENLAQLKRMADNEVSCMKLLIAKMIPTYTPEVTDATDENEVNVCMTQLLAQDNQIKQ